MPAIYGDGRACKECGNGIVHGVWEGKVLEFNNSWKFHCIDFFLKRKTGMLNIPLFDLVQKLSTEHRHSFSAGCSSAATVAGRRSMLFCQRWTNEIFSSAWKLSTWDVQTGALFARQTCH